MKNTAKGFTLIELLVVIAIIAVLSVVVILTLNPAELLRQARDSNRVSDLNTLKSAISLYLADVSGPGLGTALTCYQSLPTATPSTTCIGWMVTQTGGISSTSTVGVAGNNGWLPVNFTQVSSGAPIGSLPLDPSNNLNYFYSYMSSSALTFKLAAQLESVKFKTTQNLPGNDGGKSLTMYETGTALDL